MKTSKKLSKKKKIKSKNQLPHKWDEGDLQVEFCLESMQEDDYFTMKNLLRGYLQESPFNSSELVDIMLAQKDKIGSSITVVGQEEMFGFMSVVDMAEHWEKPSIQTIIKYVTGRVGTSSQVEEWKKILTNKDSRVGLILSERIANLPDHLAPHLCLLTFNELTHLSTNFNYFLMLTNTYKQGYDEQGEQAGFEEMEEESSSAVGKKSKKSKRIGSSGGKNPRSGSQVPSLDPTVHFYKPEDEIFKECALLSHSTRVIKNNQQNRWTLHMYTQPSRLFLLISADQLPRMVSSLKTMAAAVDADLRAKQKSGNSK